MPSGDEVGDVEGAIAADPELAVRRGGSAPGRRVSSRSSVGGAVADAENVLFHAVTDIGPLGRHFRRPTFEGPMALGQRLLLRQARRGGGGGAAPAGDAA
jgi:hypothetical protein